MQTYIGKPHRLQALASAIECGQVAQEDVDVRVDGTAITVILRADTDQKPTP